MTEFYSNKEMKPDGTGWYVYDSTGFLVEEVITNGQGQWMELIQWNASKKAYESRFPGEKDPDPRLYEDEDC